MFAQLNIHIIGGCLLRPNAHTERMFYHQLQDQLATQYDICSLVKLYNYQSFTALPHIASGIRLAAPQKNILLVQIKPDLLLQACSLFSYGSTYAATKPPLDSMYKTPVVWWKRWLQTANHLAGTIAGQHHTAITQINTQLTKCVHWSLQHGVLPIIIGPVFKINFPIDRLYAASINNTLQKAVDITGGIYIDAYAMLQQSETVSFFKTNSLQLNAWGHQALGTYLVNVAGEAMARHSKQSNVTPV